MLPLTPKNIVAVFCQGTPSIATNIVVALYSALENTATPPQFEEWARLFRMSHGGIAKQQAALERRCALAKAVCREALQNEEQELKALFALQTTYAIIIKAVASNIIDRAMPQLSPIREDYEIKDEWFSWYTTTTYQSEDIGSSVNSMLDNAFSHYENMSETETTRDLFRDLYMTIMPGKVRHSLGEFYTPAWLADSVVTSTISMLPPKAGWTAIDPCCGSGTFVTVLIRHVLEETAGKPKNERLRSVLSRVKGIDINPLAVLTTRVNYLISLSPLLNRQEEIEIPVFLGDSSTVGDVPSPSLGKCDIVVGNPPWVDWGNVPTALRESAGQSRPDRRLFSSDTFCGGIKLNLCALITHATAINYLRSDGVLAFLMPDNIVCQRSYEGFRSLTLSTTDRLYFQAFHDWTRSGKPFAPVAQGFYTYFISRRPCDYTRGVPCTTFIKKPGIELSSYRDTERFEQVSAAFTTAQRLIGQVSDGSTRFSVADNAEQLEEYRRVAGTSAYKGRQGIDFYPQDVLHLHPEKSVIPKEGRIKVMAACRHTSFPLETAYLRPLVRSVDIQRFHLNASDTLVPFPYHGKRRSPVPYQELEKSSPMLARYLRDNEAAISRSKYNARLISARYNTEFYALPRVGEYSFANCHVAFRDNSKWCACVVTTLSTPWGEYRRPQFQTHAATICQDIEGRFITFREAHFICAFINSMPATRFILNSSDNRSFKIDMPLCIPRYDDGNPAHRRMAYLSMLAHRHYNDADVMARIDSELTGLVLGL